MDIKILVGVLLVICSNVIAAVSQVLLKKAANKTYTVWWRAYINPFVIIAYVLLLGTTVFSVFALRYIPLTLSAALGASGQIFVPLLSCVLLHEKISKKRCIGMITIVLGIIIFSL